MKDDFEKQWKRRSQSLGESRCPYSDDELRRRIETVRRVGGNVVMPRPAVRRRQIWLPYAAACVAAAMATTFGAFQPQTGRTSVVYNEYTTAQEVLLHAEALNHMA